MWLWAGAEPTWSYKPFLFELRGVRFMGGKPLTERLLQEVPEKPPNGAEFDKLSNFQGGCRFVKSDPSN